MRKVQCLLAKEGSRVVYLIPATSGDMIEVTREGKQLQTAIASRQWLASKYGVAVESLPSVGFRVERARCSICKKQVPVSLLRKAVMGEGERRRDASCCPQCAHAARVRGYLVSEPTVAGAT